MKTREYGVLDDEDFLYAPPGMNREEAVRMACTLGPGHTPVRRACEEWEPFNTGVVEPCRDYVH